MIDTADSNFPGEAVDKFKSDVFLELSGLFKRGALMGKLKVGFVFIAILFAAGWAHAQGPCAAPEGVIQVNPLSLDFGSVPVGSSATLFFDIANVHSTQTLNVSELKSLNSSRFKIVNGPSIPFCLLGNQSKTIRVDFLPNAAGVISSRIRIESSTTLNSAIIDIDVIGTGTSAGGGLKVSPTSLHFGKINVGNTSTKSFVISNTGGSSATIDKITSNNSVFKVTSPVFPKNIPAGGQLPVNAEFKPTKSGGVNGSLAIIVGGSTALSVAVDGEGSSGNPNIVLNPTQLDFGNTDIGTFKTMQFTVSNTGNADLEFDIRLNPAVKVTPTGPTTLPPGKLRQFNASVIADALGTINKNLEILSNDPDTPKAFLPLHTVGVQGPFGFLNRTTRSRIAPNPNKTSALQYVDFDNDGKTDLYLTGHDGSLMCKNLGGAIFTNSTNTNKLGNNGRDSRGVSFGDADNDGDLDAFIANFDAPSVVLRNNKNVFNPPPGGSAGIVTMFPLDANTNATGGIFLDFNNDSRLDIFVVKDGEANQLFKNTGSFLFANVAGAAGVAFKGPGRSAISADFNNDGFQDLYVANFKKPNKLYLNNKNETFRDATAASGVGFTGASKQVAAIDFDGDQDLDIFVVNNEGPSVLYRNLGTGKFQNVAGASGLAGPKKGRSAAWADLDKDGDLDVVLTQSSGDNQLFRNDGNGKFTRVTNVDLGNADNPSSVVTSDSDNDGDNDIAIGDEDGGADSGDSVYQNAGGGNNNFLILTLQGSASNRSAIGAKVIVRSGAIFLAQVVSGGDGSNQSSLPLEFGLGSGTSATVIVAWPSGRIQTLENVNANQKLRIIEPI